MTSFSPRPDEDEEAPRYSLQQAILIGILVVIGIGVTAFEVLGLQPDDFGGTFPLAIGGGLLLVILGAVLRR